VPASATRHVPSGGGSGVPPRPSPSSNNPPTPCSAADASSPPGSFGKGTPSPSAGTKMPMVAAASTGSVGGGVVLEDPELNPETLNRLMSSLRAHLTRELAALEARQQADLCALLDRVRATVHADVVNAVRGTPVPEGLLGSVSCVLPHRLYQGQGDAHTAHEDSNMSA
jgi:hypothetical protein